MLTAEIEATDKEFDEVYDNISRLYDNAEKLLELADHKSLLENEDYLKIYLLKVENIIGQIEASANSLSEDFAATVESGEAPSNAMKRRVNSSLRKILLAIEEFKSEVEQVEKGE